MTKEIAGFCIHDAKHMTNEVLDQLSDLVPKTRNDYEQIEVCFPTSGDLFDDRLLTATTKGSDR